MSVQLARKWRSKNFDEIVGQELAVRLLKNSLFKQYFLPVYLFSGLRGSGKTSLARIFARAVNCAALDQFCQDPKIIVPCGLCASCQAALMGKHPDIIELDAASHTGVDNMRAILESASFLPSLGKKRIYIIDEAHMLSRAAFNACLKLFEEPPAHVLFILATTDPEKIIDTIMSRSFQVFFDPIPTPDLVARLTQVCVAENIAYDQPGLAMVAEHAQGSARDALTALERIALATGAATGLQVQKTLGVLSPETLQKLFIVMADGSVPEAIAWMHTHMTETIAPITVWRALMTMIHDALLCLYQVEPSTVYSAEWREKARTCTAAHVTQWFSHASQAEQAISKSSANREVLTALLVQLCMPSTPVVAGTAKQAPAPEQALSDDQRLWYTVIKQVLEQSKEPMVRTLFIESRFKALDPVTHSCVVQFLKEHELFSDWVEKLAPLLASLVQATWPHITQVKAEFTRVKNSAGVPPRPAPSTQPVRRAPVGPAPGEKKQYSETVNQALKLFPGTVSEL